MCNICYKPFCICCGQTRTQDIIESYIPKLSTIMLANSTFISENDFRFMQQLQQYMVQWLHSDIPCPDIHHVIRVSTIIIMRHTHLLESADSN